MVDDNDILMAASFTDETLESVEFKSTWKRERYGLRNKSMRPVILITDKGYPQILITDKSRQKQDKKKNVIADKFIAVRVNRTEEKLVFP